jgi:hypothetical protein
VSADRANASVLRSTFPHRSCLTIRGLERGGLIRSELPASPLTPRMARPRRGTLKRRPTTQGNSYGEAFTYRGQEFHMHFRGEWKGSDEGCAAGVQRFLMEKVSCGQWTEDPPPSGVAAAVSPTFQVEASQWLHRRKIRAGCLGEAPRRSATSRGGSR